MKKIKLFEEFNHSGSINEGVVSIKGGRIIAHKILNKLVDMGLIPVKKKSEDLLETIAEVIVNAKMESVTTKGDKVNEEEILVFDEIGPELEALKKKLSSLMKSATDKKWVSALSSAHSALSNLEMKLDQADYKLGVIVTEAELNEGAVKRFEMDYKDMENSIKRGIGWIDPEYVVDTWENSSDSIDFELVAGEIYNRLIKAGLLWYADENGEEKGKQVKSLKELGIKESVNEAIFSAKDFNKILVVYKVDQKAKELYVADVNKFLFAKKDPNSIEAPQRFQGMFGMMLEDDWKKEFGQLPKVGDILPFKNEKALESIQINEAYDVKVSLRHAKDAIALFNDMFIKYGKRPSTDVFSFKQKDAAVDFVQMLVKNLQIPMAEIDADKEIIKNLK
jgi:hypothetical protein